MNNHVLHKLVRINTCFSQKLKNIKVQRKYGWVSQLCIDLSGIYEQRFSSEFAFQFRFQFAFLLQLGFWLEQENTFTFK